MYKNIDSFLEKTSMLFLVLTAVGFIITGYQLSADTGVKKSHTISIFKSSCNKDKYMNQIKDINE